MKLVSAFGIIHKSESEPGQFKPVTQMTSAERGRATRLTQVRSRRAPQVNTAQHSLADTYKHHAYASRDGEAAHPGSTSAAMKSEFNPAGHTPSAVHRNIAYGPSMSPQLRAGVDKSVDPEIVKKLRHPVVFHHVPELDSNSLAAAVPAHPLTGGRGHVALGRHFAPGSKLPIGVGATRPDIINHELAHAAVRQAPGAPGSYSRTMGEEARADAVSRTNTYVKNGVVPSQRSVKFSSRLYPKSAKRPGTTVGVNMRYHEVSDLVGAAKKLRKI